MKVFNCRFISYNAAAFSFKSHLDSNGKDRNADSTEKGRQEALPSFEIEQQSVA